MKATEIRDLIFEADKSLHKVSDALAKEIEWDGIDVVYLKSKFQAVVNTTDHIKKFQIKYL